MSIRFHVAAVCAALTMAAAQASLAQSRMPLSLYGGGERDPAMQQAMYSQQMALAQQQAPSAQQGGYTGLPGGFVLMPIGVQQGAYPLQAGFQLAGCAPQGGPQQKMAVASVTDGCANQCNPCCNQCNPDQCHPACEQCNPCCDQCHPDCEQCNSCCDQCHPDCDGCRWFGEGEFLFLRYDRKDGLRVGDDSPGDDVNENPYEFSPRITVGFIGPHDAGVRGRWWSRNSKRWTVQALLNFWTSKPTRLTSKRLSSAS